MLAASTKLVRSWTRKLWSYCNAMPFYAFLCISLLCISLHLSLPCISCHFLQTVALRWDWQTREGFKLSGAHVATSFSCLWNYALVLGRTQLKLPGAFRKPYQRLLFHNCTHCFFWSLPSPIVCDIFLQHAICLMSELWTTAKQQQDDCFALRGLDHQIVVGAGLPTAAASTKWSIICFPADPVLSKQLSWGAQPQYQALPLQVILLHHVLSNHLPRSVQATLRVCWLLTHCLHL